MIKQKEKPAKKRLNKRFLNLARDQFCHLVYAVSIGITNFNCSIIGCSSEGGGWSRTN